MTKNKKDEPGAYELISPKTNRAIGIAIIGGEACVLASKSGISKMVQLIDRLRFVVIGGKTYIPYDVVVAWHHKEIELEEDDPGPNPAYPVRLRNQLDIHMTDRLFANAWYRQEQDQAALFEVFDEDTPNGAGVE